MGQIMTMFYKQEIDLVDQPPPTQELIVRSATRAFRGVYYVIGTKKANEKNLVQLGGFGGVDFFVGIYAAPPHTTTKSYSTPYKKRAKSEKDRNRTRSGILFLTLTGQNHVMPLFNAD